MNEAIKYFDSEINANSSLPEGMVSAEELEAKQNSVMQLRRLREYTYLSVAGFSCTFIAGASFASYATTEILLSGSERLQNDLLALGSIDALSALTCLGSAYFIHSTLKSYSKVKSFLSVEL